jgi:proteic killer suppression protein
VKIVNLVHKVLRRFYEQGDPKGLPHSSLDKLRKIIVYLENMHDADELRLVPVWKAHLLSGDRNGIWSLHVTRNWRITFCIDHADRTIRDVNFEDYH